MFYIFLFFSYTLFSVLFCMVSGIEVNKHILKSVPLGISTAYLSPYIVVTKLLLLILPI